jgi:hypothetical protein
MKPGNIAGAMPTVVMPQQLCTVFAESRKCVELRNRYQDRTPEAT